jgi:acyl-CoA reductase-like NAD-dependent aldehyde dehydrogenase
LKSQRLAALLEVTNLSKSEALPIYHPASGRLVGELPATDPGAVRGLYEAAHAAAADWAALAVEQRLTYLKRLRCYLAEHAESVANTIGEGTGKPKIEALTADILPTLDTISWLERHAAKLLRRRLLPTPLFLHGKQSYVEYAPYGVVLVIAPWNFPLQLALVPALTALAAGNTVIIKPSEVVPAIGPLLSQLMEQAGFPPGVVQVLNGGKELGAALVSGSPDFIFFTGSVATGKQIQAEAAKRLIPTTLELGGKDPMIVFSDANLERAVQAAIWGAFTNSGQVCMSVERLFVERSVYDRFLEMLTATVRELRQGPGEDADIGAMTSPAQIEVVRRQVADALRRGARLLTGQPPEDWQLDGGWFLAPMVLTGVEADWPIMQEETFGPVLPVMPFDSEESAIRLANDSPFGLNASVFSSDLARAQRVAGRLQSGSVVINDVIVTVANPNLPFGGVKQSGLGRYHGEMGLLSFCRQKSVMVDRGKLRRELAWYPYRGRFSFMTRLIDSFFGKTRNLGVLYAAFRELRRP